MDELYKSRKHVPLLLRILFWLIVGLAVLIVLAVVLMYLLGFFYKDRGLVDDADLSLPVATVPDSENAYDDLQKAAAALQSVNPATTVATTDPAVATGLSLFDVAAQKPSYQDPLSSDASKITLETTLPPLNSIRHAAEVHNAYAQQIAVHDPDAALQQALAGVSLGSKIEESQPFLIEWLVGVYVKDSSLETLQAIATSSTPTPQALSMVANALSAYQDDGEGLSKAITIEYQRRKSSIDVRSTENAARPSFYWHPNETIRYAAQDARAQIAMAKESCGVFTDDEKPTLLLPSSMLFWPFTPNLFGKMLFDVTSATYASAKKKQCDSNTLLEETEHILTART